MLRVPAEAVRDYLEKRFAWNHEGFIGARGSLTTYFLSSGRDVEKRHKQHVAKVHNQWTRQIGLTVARRGAGTWYAPNDSLLKALVMCIVEDGARRISPVFLPSSISASALLLMRRKQSEAFGDSANRPSVLSPEMRSALNNDCVHSRFIASFVG